VSRGDHPAEPPWCTDIRTTMDNRKSDAKRSIGDTVRLDDAHAVTTWTRCLGVTREDLEKAVQAVGSSTGAVYDFLNRNRRTR
jgi:hypothetical protein